MKIDKNEIAGTKSGKKVYKIIIRNLRTMKKMYKFVK